MPPSRADDDDAVPGALVLDDHAALEPVESGRATEPGGTPAGSWWRRLDKKLLVASLAIAVGLALIGYGFVVSITGDEAANLPAAIEEVSPAPGAIQVPQQSSVVVDMQSGYEGVLTIDGVELPTIPLDDVSVNVRPGEQVEYPPGVRYEPGNATLSFTPGAEQQIESFDQGVHTVRVVFWKTVEGEGSARSYTWTFTVV